MARRLGRLLSSRPDLDLQVTFLHRLDIELCSLVDCRGVAWGNSGHLLSLLPGLQTGSGDLPSP